MGTGTIRVVPFWDTDDCYNTCIVQWDRGNRQRNRKYNTCFDITSSTDILKISDQDDIHVENELWLSLRQWHCLAYTYITVSSYGLLFVTFHLLATTGNDELVPLDQELWIGTKSLLSNRTRTPRQRTSTSVDCSVYDCHSITDDLSTHYNYLY